MYSVFFMEISFTTVGFKNGQNLKLIFGKNAQKRENKSYTHITLHSSAVYFQNLNVIHEPCKKLLTFLIF